MKPRTQATFLGCLLLSFTHLQTQGAGLPPRVTSDLPADERLFTALSRTNALPVPPEALSVIEWPAAETFIAEKARVDRSQSIPPLYRQPKVGDAKPVRLGARSPEAASREAEQWIRRVLQPQWLPDDLADRLQTLQREPASQSIIVCRYLLDGHAIQINQSRAFMWMIIKPPKTLPAIQDSKELGQRAFNTHFLNGDRMASLQGMEIGIVAKVRVWRPDYSAPIPAGALENWWGWRLWLTDGEAVAIYLKKRSEDSARNILPDDPWF